MTEDSLQDPLHSPFKCTILLCNKCTLPFYSLVNPFSDSKKNLRFGLNLFPRSCQPPHLAAIESRDVDLTFPCLSLQAGHKEISLVFFWIEYSALLLECSFLEVSSSKWRVQVSGNTGLAASVTLVCCLPGQPLYLFNHIYYIKSCSPKN